MTEEEGPPDPKHVEYHPISGVPEEFHDFLHKDSEEYKRLKATPSADGNTSVVEGVAKLNVKEITGASQADEKPKKKKKAKEIVITRAQRQKKKAITSIEGLDLFGVKLADAAKLCGKKYACGASVVTNPSLKEQIDIQGDVQELVPELILKQYGDTKDISAKDIVMVIDKQRVHYGD